MCETGKDVYKLLCQSYFMYNQTFQLFNINKASTQFKKQLILFFIFVCCGRAVRSRCLNFGFSSFTLSLDFQAELFDDLLVRRGSFDSSSLLSSSVVPWFSWTRGGFLLGSDHLLSARQSREFSWKSSHSPPAFCQ